MPDRDLGPGCGRIGVIGRNRIVELELALLGELQNRGGGELLGDRADAKLGVERIRYIPLAVGEAIGLLENDFAVFGNEDGATESIRVDVGFKKSVRVRSVCIQGGRCGLSELPTARPSRRQSKRERKTGAYRLPRSMTLRQSIRFNGYVVLANPPSTTTISPVTKRLPAISDIMVSATSSAVTQRWSGVALARRSIRRS